MNTEHFAWREIITRVLEGLEHERDVSPSWLISPDTGRPLKLNYLIPRLSLAIRLEGLRGRGQRGKVDEMERLRNQEREVHRERLCQEHGLRLVRFDVRDDPNAIFRTLNTALAWASRQTATSAIGPEEKVALMEALRGARERSEEIRRALAEGGSLETWAQLAIDRAYSEVRSSPPAQPTAPVPRYALHMRVQHGDFGTGRVTDLTDENGDQIITVRFDGGDERQFLSRLVYDKLRPA